MGTGKGMTSPYDAGRDSPFNPASQTPFPGQGTRFGPPGQGALNGHASPVIERQTCILSVYPSFLRLSLMPTAPIRSQRTSSTFHRLYKSETPSESSSVVKGPRIPKNPYHQ